MIFCSAIWLEAPCVSRQKSTVWTPQRYQALFLPRAEEGNEPGDEAILMQVRPSQCSTCHSLSFQLSLNSRCSECELCMSLCTPSLWCDPVGCELVQYIWNTVSQWFYSLLIVLQATLQMWRRNKTKVNLTAYITYIMHVAQKMFTKNIICELHILELFTRAYHCKNTWQKWPQVHGYCSFRVHWTVW